MTNTLERTYQEEQYNRHLLDDERTHWHVGTGHLPTDEPPYAFTNWMTAKAALLDDLDRLATSETQLPDPDEAFLAEINGAVANLNATDEGDDWSCAVGNRNYWLHECNESECEIPD